MSVNNGELSFKEVVEKYPDIPQVIIRKIDTGLRGIALSEKALQKAREENAVFDASDDQDLQEHKFVIGGALFRDGTFALGLESVALQTPQKFLRKDEPYLLDVIDGKYWLVDGKEPVEEIDLVPIPEYYGKKTSRGTPMIKVITAGPPDCLNIHVFGYCHFWKEKLPCKYCSLVPYFLLDKTHTQDSLDDIYETLNEALKEEGRWTSIRIIAGSDPRGDTPYKNEVDEYIRVLGTVKKSFGTEKIYARLVASAFPKEQLERLKSAGVTSYEPHIEVWDKNIFEWVCPGKTKYFGWQYWVDNAIASVDVFGRGNVCSQLVAGAELAQPVGFKTIDEALKSSLEGVEFFAQHGLTTSFCVLWTAKGSVFYKQNNNPAPLEYYVRLAKGMHEIRKKYKLAVDFNDFKRCAIHPDTDLARLDYNEISYEPVSIKEAV
jgi:hypothetical protein